MYYGVINMIGSTFNRLTVVERAGVDGGRNVLWRCSCSCGGSAVVSGTHLRSGHSKSCGCIVAERKGKPLSKEHREAVAAANRLAPKFSGKRHTECAKARISKSLSGQSRSQEFKELQSERSKRTWQNPERIKKGWNALKAAKTFPNGAERKLLSILNDAYPGSFRYVGDGAKVIGGFCPDFECVTNNKLLVEMYGTYWHRNTQERDTKRISYLESKGYTVVVIWQHELDDVDLVVSRVLGKMGGM